MKKKETVKIKDMTTEQIREFLAKWTVEGHDGVLIGAGMPHPDTVAIARMELKTREVQS